ncbi:tonB-dependent Receptor Plug domain protein [Janthinobacterium agaricidamnosum NBRC 102515 = DSM 9628]|uniref:TonB-dependent Receptor Plug domain protein n=2 Tax=Janthinobacterium agaricidamnosum TaxID=55508 RepID=W0VCL5_9BURK|nr:tonB-dependent Receptor Plug domain protein [Janthinobacterium agaricidamnosum NBRC 102515 = DSM 9628]
MVCLGAAHAEAAPDTDAKPAAGVVTITGKKVGMGLMVQEDVPKARSTVTAEELAKQRPTGNAFDALTLMPSVNTYSYDGTGLFGGGLTLRGFNSDQVGATINGVPVNDSGSFAVYPQEYVDLENTCSEFVTQGSTDVDSPQVGATGGNFGITTCDPEDKFRFRAAQTLGQLNLRKTYLRVDTGRFANDRAKVFLSYSHADADKWKGAGKAVRDHVDLGFNYDWDRFNYIHGTVLYNKAVNNNISTFSLADLKKNGYYYDYSTTFIGHAPASPGVGVSDPSQATADSYYKLALNPFENVIASATAKFRIGEDTDIKVTPYYWYGYGTGGTQQRLVSESGFLNPATGKLNAGVDLNGDGDTKDSVIVYAGSVTRTQRPGITTSVSHNFANHQVLAGFWYERATHTQTGPIQLVDANGNPSDIWKRDGAILRPDGTPYQTRDWATISTAYQAFLQDTVSFLDDKLLVNVGVRNPHVKRDFTNNPNEGTNSAIGYHYEKSYSDLLPQFGVRYRITNDDQLFASLAKNFRAPPNFVFATTGKNIVVSPDGTATLVSDVKPETAWNLDMGYRHQSNLITTSATVFFTEFKNRQANATDPNTLTSTYTNVGNVQNKGFELELGNTPINGWSVYGSLGYLSTKIKNDIAAGIDANKAVIYLPTTGNQYPLAPKWKTGLSLSYETNDWYTRLKAKYTSKQQATLMNDEEVPGYTTVDLDAGYQFPTMGAFKTPKLTFNISNLLSRQYRNPTGQQQNALTYGAIKGSTVFYNLAAPRLVSATLQVDF